MSLPRPTRLAIMLAVVMIVLLVALTVGWVLLNVFGAQANAQNQGVFWALLTIGTLLIALLVAGVVIYLVLSIKAINLSRRQSNFVDSVTHELKSPIASLKLYLQTLHRHQVSEQELPDFYRGMLEEVERLDGLINHVLAAGKAEADPGGGDVEDVELGPLLRECAEMVCLRYRVPSDTVALDLQPCLLEGRRRDLDMIFRNLIDNAIKYAGSLPKVDVSMRRDGSRVVVRVRDNGRGIPPHLRRKLFKRFVRLGSELERDRPGTGLGLYIVYNLVRRLRGSVRVQDPPAGSGALFEVRLPCKPEPPKPAT